MPPISQRVTLVAVGEYSDMSVDEVFATAELANAYVAQFREGTPRAPWVMTEDVEVLTAVPPVVTVLTLNAWVIHDATLSEHEWTRVESARDEPAAIKVDYVPPDPGFYRGSVRVWGTDHTRVRKAYSERRAQLIAATWPDAEGDG